MKILHVGKYYPPFRGGMETVLQNIAEGLLAAGCEVTLVTAGDDTVESEAAIKVERAKHDGRLLRVGVQGTVASQPLTAGLVGVLRREIACQRPDVVQLHLPNPLAGAAWLLLQALAPGDLPPMCVWYHADITRQKLGRNLVQPIIAQCLARAARICVSSERLKSGSPVLRPFVAKTDVVPFGISPEPWSRVVPRHEGAFLFVGRLVPYKGVDILIRALAETPLASLIVVGEGPLEIPLRRLARELGVAGRVEFAGSLTEEQIAGHLGTARALILPSLDASESFGMVQLEAMAAGVPVVATDLPTGVPEVGVAGETGFLVPPRDQEALGQALARLQEDPQLCARLGEAGRRRFQERYSREAMVARLLACYRDLLSVPLTDGAIA